MVEGGGAGVDNGVPLALGAEMLLPGFAGEIAAVRAGGELSFEDFGETGDVLFGDLQEEAGPVDVRGEQVVVRDEDGGDAGAHDLEEADAAGAGSAGAEDEVGGGEGFGVVTLAVGAVGLREIPVEVRGGVFDEDVGAVPVEVEKTFAEQGGAAALEGEEELFGGLGGGVDEGVAVLAVSRDVAVAEGAAGLAVLIFAGGAEDAGQEREVIVVFGVDDGLVAPLLVERVGEEAVGVFSEAAEEEDKVGGGRVVRDGVAGAVRSACGQEVGEFGLVDGSEIDLHKLDFIVR